VPAGYRIFVSPDGNAFMTEIATLLVAVFCDLDLHAVLVQEGLPGEALDGAVELVVAPHEYFHLLSNRTKAQKRAAAAACVHVTTEQPGTPWFETSFSYCRHAPLVLDINPLGVSALAARGVNVRHLPLGYHRSWDVWNGESGSKRPIDVVFMGALTPRREGFFATNAPTFASLDCRFLLTDASRPLTGSAPNFVVGRDKLELLASAKVLINIHQADARYFEWHRVLPALANGCVVVTEPSEDVAPLRAFEHFVEAPLGVVAAYAASLVADVAHRDQLALDAHSFAKRELDMEEQIATLIPELAGAVGSALNAQTVRRVARSPRVAVAGHAGRVLRRARRDARMLIRTRHPPQKGALAELERSSKATQAGLKAVLLSNAALRRQIEALESRLSGDHADGYDIVRSAAYDDVAPELTVGVSLYNYEHHVEECLTSVLASRGILAEMIVVDDNSSDRSAERVRRFIELHDRYPIALVARHANRGLSRARNTIFELARSEYVFLLDADNAVYPDALRKLHAALAPSDAAFAYSILERFGEQPDLRSRTPGLLSELPWDVRRLLEGNYIDAMSLVRKSTWEAAGGFDSDLDERFGGWEDYAFWLSLAERGLEGLLVPEILGRYRSHRRSMLATVNLDVDSIFGFLRTRHDSLPWPAA
jgi:hypothetical protein